MSLLILSAICCLLTSTYADLSAYPQELCVWNRFDQNSRFVNGMYRIGPELANDKPYWKRDLTGANLDCKDTYLFLYFYTASVMDKGWYIGWTTNAGGNFLFTPQSGGIYAQCMSAQGSAGIPSDCGPDWLFNGGLDTNVVVTEGRCPVLGCDSITATNAQITNCYGSFAQTGDNHYTNAANGLIWWFNPLHFMWRCSKNAISPHSNITCSWSLNQGTQLYSDSHTWGGEGNFSIDLAGSNTGKTVDFACNVGAGGHTTSLAPTTTNPTAPPPGPTTPFPTFATGTPTSDPTGVTPAPLMPGETGMPTMPTEPMPTPPTTSQPSEPTGEGEKGAAPSTGMDNTLFWVLIIVLIVVLLCCCLCACFWWQKRRKNENQYFDHNNTQDQNL